ncbi:hypothetical protein HMPREF0307_01972 [Corynebacterium sp. DNF00584]|nr:hypothetical protein HMPREF0307_01972 [Corynebacterium sp. DNF00584]
MAHKGGLVLADIRFPPRRIAAGLGLLKLATSLWHLLWPMLCRTTARGVLRRRASTACTAGPAARAAAGIRRIRRSHQFLSPPVYH